MVWVAFAVSCPVPAQEVFLLKHMWQIHPDGPHSGPSRKTPETIQSMFPGHNRIKANTSTHNNTGKNPEHFIAQNNLQNNMYLFIWWKTQNTEKWNRRIRKLILSTVKMLIITKLMCKRRAVTIRILAGCSKYRQRSSECDVERQRNEEIRNSFEVVIKSEEWHFCSKSYYEDRGIEPVWYWWGIIVWHWWGIDTQIKGVKPSSESHPHKGPGQSG